ncbi:MAG: hypothetical protein HYZ01_14880 [Ignavibacteriales bacterium]|nr:hypothetical protein [Ignavibacteriales bacterium]
MRYFIPFVFLAVLIGFHCTQPDLGAQMNTVAEAYVKLVLDVGQHDADYVDAYYGPKEWQEQARASKKSLDSLRQAGVELMGRLREIDVAGQEEMLQLRHEYLLKQLKALVTRVEILGGKTYTFDDEARGIYDVTPPSYTEEHFKKMLDELNTLLPGNGTVTQRYEQFRKAFIIPPTKLDTVFKAAIEEARRRTKQHIELPSSESFVVEYVKDKSWSGYNWYKGESHSLIQINTDLPIFIDRAVDLAAHEGYPGHHVYNVMLESNLMRARGWIEFSVFPLFSPQALISEGSANYGIQVAFPGEERLAFEREVLFPLAGLDTSKAGKYYRLAELASALSYAGNEAARGYLNGTINADDAARWLEEYALMAPARAKQRVRFIDQYRSYVINYNLGQDLVKRHIEASGGTADKPEKRWEEFKRLISSPRLASGLKQ